MKKIIDILNFLASLKMTIAGGVCLAASLAIMLSSGAFFDNHHAGSASPSPIGFDPAIITIIICGLPILYNAIYALFIERIISAALLISMAMIASVFIGQVFAAGEVAFIMAMGGILQGMTLNRARKGIKELINLAPDTGRLITGGNEEIIPAAQIKIGDTLRVLPGEAIPTDGEIIYGYTSIDQSTITGESLPIDKGPGEEVFCGTINRFGSIDIRAVSVSEDSSLQKLIRLVSEADAKRAPTLKIVDKWASRLVPISLAIAIITFIITGDIVRGVTILVVFCPCALVLAAPTAIIAAVGQAAKHGVIIKSGEALENMGIVDLIAFDKTGTLTHGDLMVSDVVSLSPDLSGEELLSITAAAESRSEHPLGKAIVSHAGKQTGEVATSSKDFSMIPGKGITATVGARSLICGNAAMLADYDIPVGGEAMAALEALRAQGKATIIIADRNEAIVGQGAAVLGIIALSDRLRDAAKPMITELRKSGAEAVLLTGDNAQTAAYFAERAGIGTVHSELLPEQKVARIEELRQAGHSVCMIGDGVNDAPALKLANVGVAMGSMGSDIAIEAADIALMGDDIEKIPYLKRLSKAAVSLIKTNIILSMCINFAAIILAVSGILTPVTGALWHNGGSILVILNAALLYDRNYQKG